MASARNASAVQVRLPADEQFAELRSPIADVIVRDDAMAQQTQNARQRIPQNGRANVADVHRLGDIGRTEVNNNATRPVGFLEEQRAAPGGVCASACRHGGRLEAEIQEAGSGHLHRLAPLGDVQFARPRRRPTGADSFSAPWPAPSARCSGNRQISDRGRAAPGRCPSRRRARQPATACCNFCSRILWSTMSNGRRTISARNTS